MSTKWRWAILGGSFGVYLIGLGFLGGIVAERVRFDHRRSAVLSRYDEALRKSHAHLMQLEKATSTGAEAGEDSWTAHIRKVDGALANRDTSAAELAWRDAYVVALRSQRWENLIEAGDLYLRVGEVAGARKAAEPQARKAYLRAAVRARAEGSVDGVLRAAEAFAELGDREVTEYFLRIAESLAAPSQVHRNLIGSWSVEARGGE